MNRNLKYILEKISSLPIKDQQWIMTNVNAKKILTSHFFHHAEKTKIIEENDHLSQKHPLFTAIVTNDVNSMTTGTFADIKPAAKQLLRNHWLKEQEQNQTME